MPFRRSRLNAPLVSKTFLTTSPSMSPFSLQFSMSMLLSCFSSNTLISCALVYSVLIIWTNTRWGGHLFQRFCITFSESSQAVGLYCSCHAAQASKGNFQKTHYKTFRTSGRPTQQVITSSDSSDSESPSGDSLRRWSQRLHESSLAKLHLIKRLIVNASHR